MLTWFSEKAKWIIYIFIGFIAIALLSMDFVSLQWNTTPPVAKWGAKEILIDQFDRRYQEAIKNRENLTETDKSQIRQGLLDRMIGDQILSEEIANNHIYISDTEMVIRLGSMLHSDPRTWLPNAEEQLRQFYDERGKLDVDKFNRAMANEMRKNSPTFRYFESQIRTQAEQQHLEQLVLGAFHPTDLEAKYLGTLSTTRAKLQFLAAVTDSFPSSPVSEVAVANALQKATADSLLLRQDVAQYQAVVIPNVPSAADIKLAKDNIDSALIALQSGKPFGEVSEIWNEDAGAKADSGKLGEDFQSLDRFVPEFGQAVSNVEVGKFSAPFQTRFGWHVVLVEAKKNDSLTGKPLYKLRHILAKVTVGNDTQRDIQDKLNAVREQVLNGANLAQAAQSAGLKAETTPWTDLRLLGNYGYVNGLAAYANPVLPASGIQKLWNWSGTSTKDREAASHVLKGDKVFAIVSVMGIRNKGDTCKGALEQRIRANLALQSRQAATAAYLESLKPQLALTSIMQIAAASHGKLIADTIASPVSIADWPGLANSPNPQLARALSDSSQWSATFPSTKADRSLVVIAKPSQVQAFNDSDLWRTMLGNVWAQPASAQGHPAFVEWRKLLVNSRNVKLFVEQQFKGDL